MNNHTTTQAPARKIKKIFVIVPTASTSKTAQADIDRHCSEMVSRAAAAYSKQHIELEIHLTGKRTANHTIRNAAKKYNNVTTRTHTPDFHLISADSNAYNEIRRTTGRIAATVDGLLYIVGNRPSLTNQDLEIIEAVKNKGKTLAVRTVNPTPTRQDMQPEKALPILAESAYRVNLRDFEDLQALLDDHATHGLDDSQAPIYCGAPNAKTTMIGSPLANATRYQRDSLKTYRIWLWLEMGKRTPEIMAELRRITRTTPLICYCHNRKPCHTDIIRKAASWLNDKDAQDEQEARERNLQIAANDFKPITYMISGHRRATQNDFTRHYKDAIDTALENPRSLFVLGDATGIDHIAASYIEKNNAGSRCTKYHLGKRPRKPLHKTINHHAVYATTYTARDEEMTKDSDRDIAWSNHDQEHSGTAKNLIRRFYLAEENAHARNKEIDALIANDDQRDDYLHAHAHNQITRTRCTATTKARNQCKRTTRTGSTCYAHTTRTEKTL